MATKKKPTEDTKVEVALEHVNERAAQKRMAAKYKNEKIVEVAISPMYSAEFSKNMPVILNGVRVNVPVDGKNYKVPYSFALEIRNRIAAVDEKHKRLNRMSDVSSNFERSPGELKLFR